MWCGLARNNGFHKLSQRIQFNVEKKSKKVLTLDFPPIQSKLKFFAISIHNHFQVASCTYKNQDLVS